MLPQLIHQKECQQSQSQLDDVNRVDIGTKEINTNYQEKRIERGAVSRRGDRLAKMSDIYGSLPITSSVKNGNVSVGRMADVLPNEYKVKEHAQSKKYCCSVFLEKRGVSKVVSLYIHFSFTSTKDLGTRLLSPAC